MDAGHRIAVGKFDLARVGSPGHRGGAHRVGRAGQGNVALAREESRGGVQPYPAGAGCVDFGPGVEVGEIGRRPRRSVQGCHVGRQLDQITGDEPRRQPEVPQDLYQQPGTVATGTPAALERLLAALHTGFQSHGIVEVAPQLLIEGHEGVVGVLRGTIHRGQEGVQQGTLFRHLEVGPQLLFQLLRIAKGPLLGILLEEEIEGVDRRHAGDHLHREHQTIGLFGKDHARHEVAEGILLPVDEVLGRFNLKGVGLDRGSAVGGRTQAKDVGGEGDLPVVVICRLVLNGDVNGHEVAYLMG